MRWQIIKPSKDFYRLSVGDNLGLVILADSGTSEIIVELNRPGAQALVLGVFNSRQDENLNLKVITIHSHANTHAETMIHGLVGGQAQAQIKGLIQIKKNARQVTDFLTERIILLSDKARAIAEPELEIETDEVRASHAATVSSLNKDELFYLMSRGVGKSAAERLLATGFIARVLNRIDDDRIRKQAEDYVKRKQD